MSDQTYQRDPLWFKDAVIYEVNIKGFKDSNEDGVGDFNGLIEKLDYLEDLGITAIWVLPFYPSPLRDDGYDISDYYNISKPYGTLAQFKHFLEEAHKRDLKVITELVINHTSDKHPWFERARYAPKGSPERDYYVWSDDPNQYKDVRIIFQDFETSNWTWDPVAKAYYWHRFYSHQPDLNYDNPLVQEEIFKIIDYWTQMGIDGFRLDAIPYLYEREGTNCENLPETHEFLKKLRKYVDEKYEGVMFLAEANMWPEDSASYFGDGDECHMNYHFPIMPRMYMSVKMEDRHPITDIFDQTPEIPDNCQWAMFLRNHDELTLEMVTDEERDYMYKVYAQDRTARINLGIRRRLAPLLDNDRNKIELLNILLLSFPGTPVLYYGDEIGMGDNFYLGDRDGVRTPMQWNANQNAGFSDANPQSLYLPVIIDPEYDYKYINVARQQRNTHSLLWWTKRILAMRKRYKVFGRGDITFLRPENGKVLAFVRRYEDEVMLVVANLSRHVEAAQLDLSEYQNWTPVEIFGNSEFPQILDEPYFLTIAPHGYYWFLLQPAETMHISKQDIHSPKLSTNSLEKLFNKTNQKKLEEKILPKFFKKVNWFGNRHRTLQHVHILDHLLFENEDASYAILILEAGFRTGLPEILQLPITFEEVTDSEDDIYMKEEVIDSIKLGGKIGLLVDALYDEDFRLHLIHGFRAFAKSEHLQLEFSEELQDLEYHESNIRFVNEQYVAIEYKNHYLKFYRRIDYDPNPDYEINYWLCRRGEFQHTPELLGTIFYRSDSQFNSTLAIIQPLIHHQGYAWDYVADGLMRFVENMGIHKREVALPDKEISFFGKIQYDTLPDLFKEAINAGFVQRLELLAERTAEMHLSLTNLSKNGNPAFTPENFSLHYQRSLYSSLKSLTRVSLGELKKQLSSLPEEYQQEARQVLDLEKKMLDYFKQIFIHKFEAVKIRIHGNYHLEQVMLVDEDFIIDDFDGTYDRPFSERKLRKSPLKDVAAMLQSFYYSVMWLLLERREERKEHYDTLNALLNYWYRSMGGIFLQAYRRRVKASGVEGFIPDEEEDFRILMRIFLLERALFELLFELNYRQEWTIVPIRSILEFMDEVE